MANDKNVSLDDLEASHKLLDEKDQGSKDNKRESNSIQEFVQFLTSEIKHAAAESKYNSKEMQNLEFFHFVQAGNVNIVRNVFEYLDNNEMQKELIWAVGEDYKRKIHPCCPIFMRLLHIVLCLFYTVMNIFISPIFYGLHAMVHSIYASSRLRISHNITLPLMYAVLSEKPEMVRLFLEYGSKISMQDENGNNIFHYLADLSMESPNKAITCHQLMKVCVPDLDILREALMGQENYLMLNGLEAIGKFGSLAYFHHILEAHGCIGKRRLEISDESIWSETANTVFNLKLPNQTLDAPSSDDIPRPVSLCIWQFDMNKYEKKDVFGKQSYLLQLVTGRSADSLPECDASAVIKSRILSKWMQSKRNIYITFCILTHGLSVMISISILLYLMLHGGDMDEYPLTRSYYHELFDIQAETKTANHSHNVTEILFAACNGKLSPDEISANVDGEGKDTKDWIEKDWKTDNILFSILVFLLLLQFLMDLTTRIVHLWRNYNVRARSSIGGIIPVIFRWIPGSYAEKQISMASFVCFVLLFLTRSLFYTAEFEFRYLRYNYHELKENFSNMSADLVSEYQKSSAIEADKLMEQAVFYHGILSFLFILFLLIRFLHTIHSMRLLPGIGFFVITTKKMSMHLIQFAFVFVFVMLAFSIMFHFILRDPECPALRINGYESLLQSMFATYQIALGQGSAGVFKTNVNAMVAYIACTIIIIIMLLNLIIAVMTTTATDMNQMPWKKAVCVIEMWDELLGVEAQVLTFIMPFTALIRRILRCPAAKVKGSCIYRYKKKHQNNNIYRIVYQNNEQDGEQ